MSYTGRGTKTGARRRGTWLSGGLVVGLAFAMAGCVRSLPVQYDQPETASFDPASMRVQRQVDMTLANPVMGGENYIQAQAMADMLDVYGLVSLAKGADQPDYHIEGKAYFVESTNGLYKGLKFLGGITLTVIPFPMSYDIAYGFKVTDREGNLVKHYQKQADAVFSFKQEKELSYVYFIKRTTVESAIPFIPLGVGLTKERAGNDAAFKVVGSLLTDMRKDGLL